MYSSDIPQGINKNFARYHHLGIWRHTKLVPSTMSPKRTSRR